MPQFKATGKKAPGLSRCYVIVLAACWAWSSTTVVGQTAGKKEKGAQVLYQEAVTAARKGEWKKALELFRKSLEKGAPPLAHYNIARCLEELGRFEEAVTSYRKYLEDPSATDREEVENRIKVLLMTPSPVNWLEPRRRARYQSTKRRRIPIGENSAQSHPPRRRPCIEDSQKGFQR